jgi:hypothetical protein
MEKSSTAPRPETARNTVEDRKIISIPPLVLMSNMKRMS